MSPAQGDLGVKSMSPIQGKGSLTLRGTPHILTSTLCTLSSPTKDLIIKVPSRSSLASYALTRSEQGSGQAGQPEPTCRVAVSYVTYVHYFD